MSSRTYAPQSPPGPNERAVAAMLPSERARYKAERMAQVHSGSLTWTTEDGITITASGWRDDDGVFEVKVAARDANGTLPLDNPYRFANPPIKVPDGTWRQESDEVGLKADRENYREDVLGAAKLAIAGAVRTVAMREGWEPSQP